MWGWQGPHKEAALGLLHELPEGPVGGGVGQGLLQPRFISLPRPVKSSWLPDGRVHRWGLRGLCGFCQPGRVGGRWEAAVGLADSETQQHQDGAQGSWGPQPSVQDRGGGRSL